MKITVRRGTSHKNYGFAIKWKVFADDQLIGQIKDKGSLTFELPKVDVIKITALFQHEVLIPLKDMSEDVEIRCFIQMGLWTNYIYAYAFSKDKYLGEYVYN